MIFLYSQDKRYSIFRIKHLLRNLNKKKSSLKRLSEQKTKVINQISLYEGILQKLQQYEGDVHYGNEDNEPIFTEQEIFYISMILCMRHCYERMKQLSKRIFNEESEKLHIDIQNWLCRVLQLDPTLFDDYLKLNRWNYQIVPIEGTVAEMRTMHAPEHFRNQYQIWVSNLNTSFLLLDDYTIWRQTELRRMSTSNSPSISFCDCPAMCFCKVDDMKELMYKIICLHVFFQTGRHEPPASGYWEMH